MVDPRQASVPPGVAPQVVFLPGLDGETFLRDPFLEALRESFPVTAIIYPNQVLGSVGAYGEFAARGLDPPGGFILVAESFSGLIAIRWAATDKRVKGLVLCGAFVQNPMGLATKIAAARPGAVKWIGARALHPFGKLKENAVLRRVIDGLRLSLEVIDADVLGERLRMVRDYDARKALSRVKVPTVLLHFSGDLLVGETHRRYVETLCHNPESIRIEGPHLAIETRPRDCAAALREPIQKMMKVAAP